jgi:Na+-translocating ferredoxin:NAD+ oxidoreductase subunit G
MSHARSEVATIVLSMVTVCGLGAAVLGGVYVVTARHSEAQERATEAREVSSLLALDARATVLEVRSFLWPERRAVLYRATPMGGEAEGLELAFDLDGVRIEEAVRPDGGGRLQRRKDALVPLGRVFVARRDGVPAGFVVEGESRGYKNRIRFLVGLSSDWRITGVRVVEHEEDPGLGAEIATPEFEGQFVGRSGEAEALRVTRDPMPEDWRSALTELRRMARGPWSDRHRGLRQREGKRPIYAVTGATISSRALSDGVRVTVERFRSRWERIAPHLGAVPAAHAAAEGSR